MKVSFRTKQLQKNYADDTKAIRKRGPDVGRMYIARIKQFLAISNLETAYRIKPLGLHPLKNDKRGQLSLRLGGSWRLIVTKSDSDEHVIIQEVSNHYD